MSNITSGVVTSWTNLTNGTLTATYGYPTWYNITNGTIWSWVMNGTVQLGAWNNATNGTLLQVNKSNMDLNISQGYLNISNQTTSAIFYLNGSNGNVNITGNLSLGGNLTANNICYSNGTNCQSTSGLTWGNAINGTLAFMSNITSGVVTSWTNLTNGTLTATYGYPTWYNITNGTLALMSNITSGVVTSWTNLTNGTLTATYGYPTWYNITNGTIWSWVINSTADSLHVNGTYPLAWNLNITNNFLNVSNGSTSYFFINASSGYSGFNTTSPTSTLYVNGNETVNISSGQTWNVTNASSSILSVNNSGVVLNGTAYGFPSSSSSGITWGNAINGTLAFMSNITSGVVTSWTNLTNGTLTATYGYPTWYNITNGTLALMSNITSGVVTSWTNLTNGTLTATYGYPTWYNITNGTLALMSNLSAYASWIQVINGTAITFLDNATNNQTRNINISNPLAQDYFNISNQTTSEFVVLGSSGKIGINTTAPQNALNVKGGLNISNINGLNSFVINETTGFVGINTTTLSSTSWGSTLNIFGNSSFNYTYTNTTANSSVNYTAENILASRWMAVNSFDAGNLVGLNLSVLRGTSLNDNGTMNGSSYWSGLFGEVINYGFSNMTGGLINGNTTNAYGLFIQPYLQTGNITNMYDLFIGNLTNTALVNFSGGIITNFWGIYENSTAKNYIAGNTTINNNVNITGQGNITLSANSMIQLTVNTTALICGASSNGTIARNATGLIYCNGTNSWWYLGTPHG
jgi:hypothetical protein